jgi:hypothetical protein
LKVESDSSLLLGLPPGSGAIFLFQDKLIDKTKNDFKNFKKVGRLRDAFADV